MANIEDIKNQLYTDCPLTKFPDGVDIISRKEDVNNETVSWVNEYARYVSAGDMTGAARILSEHPSIAPTLVGADYFNTIRDGLIAVERIFNGYVADYIAHVVKDRGTWSAETQYNKYDLVFYSVVDAQVGTIPQAFIALPQSDEVVEIPIGTLPTNTTYWKQITIQGTRFTPSATEITTAQGLRKNQISWSNTDGLVNPLSFDVKDGVRFTPGTSDYTVPGTESLELPLKGKTISWTHDGDPDDVPTPSSVNIINGVTYGPIISDVSRNQGGKNISWWNNGSLENPDDVDIMNGITFTPQETQITGGWRISWTNDGDAQNPPSVDIFNGASGTGYSPRGIYDPTQQYYKDDIVIHKSVIWYANQNVKDVEPSESASQWNRFGNIALNFDTMPFTLQTSSWVANTDSDASIYPYKATFFISGVNENSRVDVMFDEESKEYSRDARVSTTTYTVMNGVVLKSKTIPAHSLAGDMTVFQRTDE